MTKAARPTMYRFATANDRKVFFREAAFYEDWHAAFRQHQPKTLILWGKHDPFFIEAGAEAFLKDIPEAKLVWLDAGHFVLDENATLVASEIKAAFAGH